MQSLRLSLSSAPLAPQIGSTGLSPSTYKPYCSITYSTPYYLARFGKVFAVAKSNKITALEKEQIKENETKEELPSVLNPELIPAHVAVIMDGNRRWASEKGLPMEFGHRKGAKRLAELAYLSLRYGIHALTVFMFSSENWGRPKVEVDFLMKLFEKDVIPDLMESARESIKISFLGDISKLPKSLQIIANEAEQRTKNNTRLHLMVAINYSGRHDIVNACKSIATKVKDNVIQSEDINETLFEQELQTKCTEFPRPDLLIRSSGELRLSNFLMWQLAYTELYFLQAMWPDFGEDEFVEALYSFQKRQRRFGGHKF